MRRLFGGMLALALLLTSAAALAITTATYAGGVGRDAPIVTYITRSSGLAERTSTFSRIAAYDVKRGLRVPVYQHPFTFSMFTWANDKLYIASIHPPLNGTQIAAYDPATRDLTWLTAEDGYDSTMPNISGQTMVYKRAVIGTRRYDIYQMHLPTGELTPLQATTAMEANPQLSPDGARLAFYVPAGGAGLEAGLYVRSVAAGTVERVAPPVPHFRWSGDSRYLVYTDADDIIRQYDIMTGQQEPFAPVLRGNYPVPSPDGRYLVYYSGQSGETALYLADLTTGDTDLLWRTILLGAPVWLP